MLAPTLTSNLREHWEKLLLALVPLLPLKVLLRSCHILRMTGQQAVLRSLLQPWGTTPIAGCFSPGSSATRSRQPSAIADPGVLIPGLSDLTCPTLLWTEQTLSPVDVAVQPWARALFTPWLCYSGCRLRKVCACVASPQHPPRSHLLSFYGDLERWHRR